MYGGIFSDGTPGCGVGVAQNGIVRCCRGCNNCSFKCFMKIKSPLVALLVVIGFFVAHWREYIVESIVMIVLIGLGCTYFFFRARRPPSDFSRLTWPLDRELALASHLVSMTEEKKQAAEKKIFWIILACGPCGIGASILLFGFPKAGAYGSYEGWEGWVLGLAAFFAAWRQKKRISNDTSEKLE